ncbi:hypothetical protein F5B18DRAFT_649171 [Nemania serpens]|nr:hypothetical protein F5B18DRAFT_649171 [Nemania serpens]
MDKISRTAELAALIVSPPHYGLFVYTAALGEFCATTMPIAALQATSPGNRLRHSTMPVRLNGYFSAPAQKG